MNTPNVVLMTQAREVLKGKWLHAIKAFLVYVLVMILLNVLSRASGIFTLLSLVVVGPLTIGLCGFWISFSKNQNPKLEKIFDGFKTWWRGAVAYFLVSLYTFLWFLLLIIPGIIAMFWYSQTFYILAEDPNIEPNDAIRKSKEMMKGNKWKLFCLSCRFIGWSLLCLLTLGIGFLWLGPYIRVTFAKFYDDIKGSQPPQPAPIPTPIPVPTA